jgi:hypothetical protein
VLSASDNLERQPVANPARHNSPPTDEVLPPTYPVYRPYIIIWMPAEFANKCPHCDDTLVPGKMYCANCGQPVVPADHKVALDSYIAAKVAQEISLKTQGESAVVRDLAFKAEDEVWKRLKRYGWIVGLFVVLLAFIGFGSIQDAKQKIVDEARSRVEPIVKDVEKRAQVAQTTLADVEKSLPGVTASLNKTAELADQQRKRIEGQSADVAAKLNNFQTAATRADKLSAGFEAKVSDSQKRLDDLTKRYDTQIAQISRAVTHTTVAGAFPNLDREPFVEIGDARFDRIQKKTGEKWVDIQVTQLAQASGVIAGTQIEALTSDVIAAGFTPFFNYIQIGGRLNGIIERAGQGSDTSSAVLYFRPSFKASADRLTEITATHIPLPQGSPVLSDSGQMEPFLKAKFAVLLKDGKLDAQIFISAPPPK